MTKRSKRWLILLTLVSVGFNGLAFVCMANAKVLLDSAVIMAKSDGMFILYGSMAMIPVSIVALITIARSEASPRVSN